MPHPFLTHAFMAIDGELEVLRTVFHPQVQVMENDYNEKEQAIYSIKFIVYNNFFY